MENTIPVKIPPPNGVAAQGKHYYQLPNGVVFEIDTKYELTEMIAKCGFGTVCSAVNTETNEKVAIKMIEHVEERRGAWRKILRELELLRQIHHPFIIRMKDVMKPSEPKNAFKTIYIVFELMRTDLVKFIRNRGELPTTVCQLILSQLLRAIKYLHSGNVVHRDVKAANVLVGDRLRVKLCDFGLSRIAPGRQLQMTQGFGSLQYLSPEQLLVSKRYTSAVDIWAVGCVFVRLLHGKLLFNASTVADQVREIANVIPKPKSEDLDFLDDKNCCKFVDKLPEPTTSLRQKIPNADPDAIDLLEKMLVFDPRKRISAADALLHPFVDEITIDDLKDGLMLSPYEVEMLTEDRPLALDFNWEEFTNAPLTDERGRAKVYDEILRFRRSKNNDNASSSSSSSSSGILRFMRFKRKKDDASSSSSSSDRRS